MSLDLVKRALLFDDMYQERPCAGLEKIQTSSIQCICITF